MTARPRGGRADPAGGGGIRSFAAAFVVFFSLAACGGGGGGGGRASSADSPEPARAAEGGERFVRFRYEAAVRVPQGTKRLVVWIPLPKSDDAQEIGPVEADAPVPFEETADTKYGNRFARFTVTDPPEEVRLALAFSARRRAVRGARADNLPPALFLAPDRLVPSTGPIAAEARAVAGGETDPLEIARRLYDHIVATVRYDKSGTGWGRGDALYACEKRAGNCTDFHSLFLGEARALGVPARFEMGVPLPPEDSGVVPGYHCWASFYLPGAGWVPLDASEAHKHPERKDELFGGLDADRIHFTTGRDIPLPGAKAPPVNYAIYPHAEADGTPVSSIEHRFVVLPATSGERDSARS